MQETKVKAERISLAVVTAGLVITACGRLASRADREGTSAALSAIDFVAEIVMIAVFAALVFRALNRRALCATARGVDVGCGRGLRRAGEHRVIDAPRRRSAGAEPRAFAESAIRRPIRREDDDKDR